MAPPSRDDDDVRAQRAGNRGDLERMDKEEWPDAHTPFGRALRHNVNSIYAIVLDHERRIATGERASDKVTGLETLLLGDADPRTDRISGGGVLGRLESKVDALDKILSRGQYGLIAVLASLVVDIVLRATGHG